MIFHPQLAMELNATEAIETEHEIESGMYKSNIRNDLISRYSGSIPGDFGGWNLVS
jgi:hypothetical protein